VADVDPQWNHPLSVQRWKINETPEPGWQVVWSYPTSSALDFGAHTWRQLATNLLSRMDPASMAVGADAVYSTHQLRGEVASSKYWPAGLYANARADGALKWQKDGAWGGVSTEGGLVYATNLDDKQLHVFDGTGKEIWHSAALDGVAHHPSAVAQGIAVVVTDAGTASAFRVGGDMAAAWSMPIGGGAALTPAGNKTDFYTIKKTVMAIAAGTGKSGVIVFANGNSLKAIDLHAGGNPLWSATWTPPAGHSAGIANPIVYRDGIVVSAADGVVARFAP
jgi:DNA-binding beta-propeller fold protein YncE